MHILPALPAPGARSAAAAGEHGLPAVALRRLLAGRPGGGAPLSRCGHPAAAADHGRLGMGPGEETKSA
eukprot:681388-Pyramimonas_sp.AAC.1